MSPSPCHLNVLLACTDSDNKFDQATIDRLSPEVANIIANSNIAVSKALFIYYAASEDQCEDYLRDNIQKLFGKRPVECIIPGQDANMIDQAECIVVGGGDLNKLVTKASPFGGNIWKKVLSGVPFVGINAGAMFLSSRYITIPAGTVSNFNFFPLQYISAYTNSTQDQANIKNILNNNQQIRYALCMPNISNQGGGGIILEDATAGLAGLQSSGSGGGSLKELYIYERDGGGGISEVIWTSPQRKQLPINYM